MSEFKIEVKGACFAHDGSGQLLYPLLLVSLNGQDSRGLECDNANQMPYWYFSEGEDDQVRQLDDRERDALHNAICDQIGCRYKKIELIIPSEWEKWYEQLMSVVMDAHLAGAQMPALATIP
jgi:hypothetical protein